MFRRSYPGTPWPNCWQISRRPPACRRRPLAGQVIWATGRVRAEPQGGGRPGGAGSAGQPEPPPRLALDVAGLARGPPDEADNKKAPRIEGVERPRRAGPLLLFAKVKFNHLACKSPAVSGAASARQRSECHLTSSGNPPRWIRLSDCHGRGRRTRRTAKSLMHRKQHVGPRTP